MDAYVGEIRMLGYGKEPTGWMLCDGRTLSVSRYQLLFAVINSRWGGDGQTTFAIPNLCYRVPIGQNHPSFDLHRLGEVGGEVYHQLVAAELPPHRHAVNVVPTPATDANPTSAMLLAGAVGTDRRYAAPGPTGFATTALSQMAVSAEGSSAPHYNMMPSIALNFVICTNGLFPVKH